MNFNTFYDQYYSEEYLSGEFTFGFELEGFHINRDDLKDIIDKHFPNADDVKDDCSVGNRHGNCGHCGGWGRIDNRDGGEEICLDCDGTGQNKTEKECAGNSFEWASPVLQFNPSALSTVIKFFNDLNSVEGFDVNESCGFHVHLGMPTIYNVQEEWFWVLAHMAVDDIAPLSDFLTFGQWDFVNDDYASTKFLSQLRHGLQKNKPDIINDLFDEDKYRAFRIHPQGTLEWRGPRGFVIHQKQVKSFFLNMLPELVNLIKKAQSSSVIKVGKWTYNKNEMFKLLAHKAKQSEYMYNKKSVSNKRFFFTMSKTKITEMLQRYPWLKKAKFENLECELPYGSLSVSRGTWISGDFYGVFCGSGVWRAPKEQMKGIWVGGFIELLGLEYVTAERGAKYFGYNQNERRKALG